MSESVDRPLSEPAHVSQIYECMYRFVLVTPSSGVQQSIARDLSSRWRALVTLLLWLGANSQTSDNHPCTLTQIVGLL
jgi:hypothetical protein